MFFTLSDTSSIPMGAVYLHARMFWTLAHMTIPVGAMYLDARMFCTLAHTTSIPVGAMLHARTFCTLSDTILYPLQVPILTMITEVWPRANWAMVTKNLTIITEVMLNDVMLIEGFLYKRKSTGPNTEPCGTPNVMFEREEMEFLTETKFPGTQIRHK